MKTVKRALALLLALTMLLATGAVTVLAANTYTITISGSKVVSGHTYQAYQIFAGDLAEKDNKTILSNIKWGNGVDGEALLTALKADTTFGSDFSACTTAAEVAEKLATYENDAEKTQQFAKLAGANLTTTVAGTSQWGETNKEYTISGLAAGYYLVKDVTVPADDAYTRYILEVVHDVTVNPKTDVPTVDKKIKENNTTTTVNEASIGDTIDYVVTSRVPDMTGYNKYYFVLNDTMSKGLTFNVNSVEVTIGNTKLGTDAYTVTPTTNDDGTTTVKIVLNNFIQYKGQKDAVITVTYSATLNENAEVGKNPNVNEVKLTYSNNPNYNYTGENEPGKDEPTGETPESKVETYTTELTITKTDSKGNILTGAEFTLTGEGVNIVLVSKTEFTEDANGDYWKLKNDTYTKTAPTNETKDQYASETTKYTKTTTFEAKGTDKTETTVKGYVDAEGKITFRGLGAGTYTLTETATPAGYNTIAPITFTITFNKDTKTFSSNNEQITVDGTTNTFFTTIVNNSGAELPSTGGVGTTIFYVLGGLLVVCAGVLLITKRRMNKEA